MMDIYQLRKCLDLHKEFRQPDNKYCYEAIFVTGGFNGLYDYGAGILGIRIHIKHPQSHYPGCISIYTVDDGVWQAHCNTELNEAKAQEIIQIFNTYEGRLPSEEQLNSDLQKVGCYGTFTG